MHSAFEIPDVIVHVGSFLVLDPFSSTDIWAWACVASVPRRLVADAARRHCTMAKFWRRASMRLFFQFDGHVDENGALLYLMIKHLPLDTRVFRSVQELWFSPCRNPIFDFVRCELRCCGITLPESSSDLAHAFPCDERADETVEHIRAFFDALVPNCFPCVQTLSMLQFDEEDFKRSVFGSFSRSLARGAFPRLYHISIDDTSDDGELLQQFLAPPLVSLWCTMHIPLVSVATAQMAVDAMRDGRRITVDAVMDGANAAYYSELLCSFVSYSELDSETE